MSARSIARSESEELPEFWISYSDLMVSLLMTFALLLFLAMARLQSEVKLAEGIVKANTDAVREAVKALGGQGSLVSLDSATGTLTMNAEVLFDFGSAEVKPEARGPLIEVAEKFIPRLLQQPSVDSMVQEIAIEGHTDTVGTFMSNLRLSQARAYAVMTVMEEGAERTAKAERFRTLVTATGKSESNPIKANGSIDADKSRRIEIHIRFRDDVILKRILGTKKT